WFSDGITTTEKVRYTETDDNIQCYCFQLVNMQSDPPCPESIKNSILVTMVGSCLLLIAEIVLGAVPVEEITVEVEDVDLSLRRFDAQGEHLIIWVSPGFGDLQRAYEVAYAISKRGIEVWHIDLAESLFLPPGTNTLRALDGRYVAGLIKLAHRQTGKNITLMTRSYAALPVLRGARLWQLHSSDEAHETTAYLTGAILFSPELYSEIPPLGSEPVFDPIASASNIPIMLYQAGQHGNRWQLDKTLELLQNGGAPVYLKILPGVTGVFYLNDTAAETHAVLKKLPGEIERVLAMLKRVPTPTAALSLHGSDTRGQSNLDMTLEPFSSPMQARAIELKNVKGEMFTRHDFTGRVTLVNFWATWCGPCIEEIPALNRLRQRMQEKPFELISINYAEKPQQIREFLNLVEVDFPVLLDEDGSYTAKWNVLVYPATFVIATDGTIAYGVNGAIEWDSDDIVLKLEALMKH
ncbi:MAG: TlpA disulfide reductase family protein, partial [Gammaproteobacteria bacterium]